jgi:hypothetical protein
VCLVFGLATHMESAFRKNVDEKFRGYKPRSVLA